MVTAPELVGRYEVFPPFARGGMATMHVGRLRGPGGFSRLVAVKRSSPALGPDVRDERMLLEEARVAARIRSPFVVPVIELLSADKQLSIVMELVHGVALSTLLACAADDRTRVPPSVAVAILADVLRGLHAAHEATDSGGRPLELVHRDVSPQNILVGVDGVTRVVDFGIARAIGREPLTQTGEVKGKLAYIAPEQLRPGPITRQADIYAAGVVLWEILTGERFRDESDPASILASSDAPATRPSSRFATIPAELDEIATQALSREPRERFATAEAMAIALEEANAPANRDEVSRFVERVAHRPLDLLADAMQTAERWVPSPLEDEPAGPLTRAPDAAIARRHLFRGLALGVALATIAGTGALLVSRAFTANSKAGELRAPGSVSGATGAASASSTVTGEPPAAASSTRAGESTATSTNPALPSSPAEITPRVASARAAGAQRRPSSPASNGCVPPYTIDDAGLKHYKPACIP